MTLPPQNLDKRAKRLTILIPTHNRPALLRSAVKSAQENSPEDAEILIIDDASNPPAKEAIADLLASDPRLRIMRNEGTRGAAGARNFGLSQATGEIVLFLDDDDELISDYPHRVLDIAATSDAGYGFSAILRRDATGQESRIGRSQNSGKVSASSVLRHKLSGLGNGFWIRHALYLEIGGLAPSQTIDEDTDLCCNLVRRGYLPWYENQTGVRINVGHTAPNAAGAQLTQSSHQDIGLACYLRTWQKHEAHFPALSEARWFLGTRYLRRAAKSGATEQIGQFLRESRPLPLTIAFRIYVWLKLRATKRRPG